MVKLYVESEKALTRRIQGYEARVRNRRDAGTPGYYLVDAIEEIKRLRERLKMMDMIIAESMR